MCMSEIASGEGAEQGQFTSHNGSSNEAGELVRCERGGRGVRLSCRASPELPVVVLEQSTAGSPGCDGRRGNCHEQVFAFVNPINRPKRSVSRPLETKE